MPVTWGNGNYIWGIRSQEGLTCSHVGTTFSHMNPTDAKIAAAVGDAICNQNATIRDVAKATRFTRWGLGRKIKGKARKGFNLTDLYQIARKIGVRFPEFFRSAGQ